MRVLIRDYLEFHGKKLLFDVLKAYGFFTGLIGALLGQAMLRGQLERVIEAWGSRIAIVTIVLPGTIICLPLFISLWLTGRNLARSAGEPLSEYVDTEAYKRYGTEKLRKFWSED